MDEGLEKTMLGVRLWRHVGVWSPKNKTNVYCKDGVHLSHLSETQGYPIATVSEHQLFQGLIVYRLRRINKNAQ